MQANEKELLWQQVEKTYEKQKQIKEYLQKAGFNDPCVEELTKYILDHKFVIESIKKQTNTFKVHCQQVTLNVKSNNGKEKPIIEVIKKEEEQQDLHEHKETTEKQSNTNLDITDLDEPIKNQKKSIITSFNLAVGSLSLLGLVALVYKLFFPQKSESQVISRNKIKKDRKKLQQKNDNNPQEENRYLWYFFLMAFIGWLCGLLGIFSKQKNK